MNNILQTRILPHKLTGKIVNRDLLVSKISGNIDKSLILICAPAGYGKTSLTQEFLSIDKYQYSWLNIHAEMNNFYIFMNYLVYSLEKINNNFGKATLLLIEDYRERYQLSSNLERIINDVTGTFINELCNAFEKDVFVVIDDLGNIDKSDWLSHAFTNIFENLPPNIHFIITSRTIPGFSTSILQAKRKILKIEMKDLAFTFEETRKLVNEQYEIVSPDSEIHELTENLGGWITGMHLTLQSYGSSFPDLRLDKIIIFDDVFNYFTEDIFNSLMPELKDFLVYTSILDIFTPEICDDLLRISNSRTIINELLNKNIFIQIAPALNYNKSISYSYQVLFKKFLNLKLKELKTDAEINSFLLKVSEYYSSKKEIIQAVNYSLLAGDNARALSMIHENFQGYFDEGSFEILWKWLDELGLEIIKTDYKLLYFKSLLLKFFMGNIEESLPLLESSIKLCKSSNDPAFLVKCYISKSRNLISLGRVSEAIKVLKSAEDIKADTISKARLLFLTAYAYYQNADYDKSIDILNNATTIIEEETVLSGAVTDIRMEIFNLYGHIFLIKGDYSKSISYYERVVKNTGKTIGRYETICNLILLYSQAGKFDKAFSYLAEAKDITANITIPIFRITYLLAYQALKFEFGDYEESIRLLKEMNNIASGLNHKYYIYLSYSLIGDSYYSLNKLGKAEEYYDMAFRYLNDNNELEKIQYSVSKALLLKKAEPISEIETVLAKAYTYFEEKKMIYNKIQIAFHLADYYRRVGNVQKAYPYLKEALNVSEEKEYSAFIQREILNFRPLFDMAISANIQKDFIKILLNLLLEKKHTGWISIECKKRLLEINDSLYDIKLNLFGKNDVFLRGKLLAESQWSKKKWKLIFIYLMLYPKKVLTKDKIIDLFYPDTSVESADNIFHQVISKFRNLVRITSVDDSGKKLNMKEVKVSTSKKKKGLNEINLFPSLVIYEDKLLQVNEDFSFYIDSVEFEKLYKQIPVETIREKRIEIIKQAIELYKGDFMEGNYETWCEELRTKYRSYFVSMSEELIKLLFSDENYSSALHYSENLLKYDLLNLTCYEYIINSMVKLNKPQIAKARYHQLVKYYKKEYDESLPLSLSKRFENIITN